MSEIPTLEQAIEAALVEALRERFSLEERRRLAAAAAEASRKWNNETLFEALREAAKDMPSPQELRDLHDAPREENQ